jgi:serine/threonine protein kinase
MGTPAGIANMIAILKKPSTNPSKDQKYVLETLGLMSKNLKVRPFLADSKVEELLMPLVSSPNDFLSLPSKEILGNIKVALNEKRAEVSNTLRTTKLLHDDIYLAGLLEKLNLDDNIRSKDIVLKKMVGEGAFGSVYLAEYHGYPVACKVIKVGLNRSNASKVLDELKLMRRLKHPNVVLLMGACLNEENQIMIVTEFASRGDLKHCLNDIESLAQRIRMLQDVIVGLHWLQAYNIVHRDLKLDNLLVAEDYTVKLTDFGLSIESDGQTYNRFGGNIKYSAPEILRERFVNKNHNYPYGERTDVYSFGLIWWQVLTKKNPFMDRPTKYPGKEGLVKFILEGHRPPLPKHWPESLKNIISACWAPLQSKRPSFRQILDKWENLTLDLMSPDPLGRTCCNILWKDHKAKKSYEEVKKIFTENCMAAGRMKDKDSTLLSSLLCESAFDDTVSFSRFCYAVGWFGPLDKESNCFGFFSRIRDLQSQNYFHGFMSDAKAEQLLSNVFDTTSTRHSHYLLKYSLNSIGEFKLAYIDKNRKVNYVKIHNANGQWRIGQSPKICDNWKRVKLVCKQVLSIGSHVPKKKIL